MFLKVTVNETTHKLELEGEHSYLMCSSVVVKIDMMYQNQLSVYTEQVILIYVI